MKMASSSSMFGSAGLPTDVGGKARLAAEVIQQVRAKDAMVKMASLKAKISNGRLAQQKAAQVNMTDAEKIKHAASRSAEPLNDRSNGKLLDLDALKAQRPTFLMGLGHSALVALSYPIENMSTFNFPGKSSPSAFSLPSLSVRAEPSETLLSKLSSFRGSVSSGLSGTGWWARDPNGDDKPRNQRRSDTKALKRAEAAEAVQVSGIIAIAPTLDPNQAVKSSNVFMRFSRRA